MRGGGEENPLLSRLVYVLFLNSDKIGQHGLFIFIARDVTSFSFSNCTLSLRLVLLYTV